MNSIRFLIDHFDWFSYIKKDTTNDLEKKIQNTGRDKNELPSRKKLNLLFADHPAI